LKKLFAWLLLPPVALIIIMFAIANRAPVTVDFDPLPFALVVPLYAVVMFAMLLGLLFGGVAAWLTAGKWRRRARERGRESRKLEADLARRPEPVPAIVSGPIGG
jgi:uncharacterized integral membrane protein